MGGIHPVVVAIEMPSARMEAHSKGHPLPLSQVHVLHLLLAGCRDITLPTKVRLVKAMVFPVVMYGCAWSLGHV